MNNYEKYVKYKNKYLNFIKNNKFIQFGGNYKINDKIRLKKKDNFIEGIIKKKWNDKGEILYTVSTNEGDIYISEKKIIEDSENNKTIEKNKSKPESKYGEGNLVKFIDVNTSNDIANIEKKLGQIVRKRFEDGKYIYNIVGPREGRYNVNEYNIIRMVTKKEIDEYKKKVIENDFNINIKPIIDNNMQYSNCVEDECHDTVIEAKIGELYGVKYDKGCDITFICDITDIYGNQQQCQCKYFMDMSIKQNKILICSNYSALLHELKILKYIKRISESNKDIKNVLKDHIIIIDEEHKMPLESFNYMLKYFKDQMNTESLIKLKEYKSVYNVSNFSSNFRGIITPYIKNNLLNISSKLFGSTNIIKSVFNILYCVYVLHNLLDIMHFNCDFENFSVLQNAQNIQHYKIGSKYYTMISNFCIKICNFEQSTKIKKNTSSEEIFNNEFTRKQVLCHNEGKCNKYNQKDIFIIISSLLMCAFDNRTKLINNKMYEIILFITNNNYGLISVIIKNNNKIYNKNLNPNTEKIFKSFCKYNLENLIETGELKFKEHECSDENIPDLSIDIIIEKYINKYSDELQLEEIN